MERERVWEEVRRRGERREEKRREGESKIGEREGDEVRERVGK